VRIGQLAGKAGVTAKTLRYYERIGLLTAPVRSESGYRDYPVEVLRRLGFIKAAQAIGLSLGEIRQVIGLRERGETPCDHVSQLLERRTADLDERIEDLQRLRRELTRLTRRARHLNPMECDPRGICHLISPSAAFALR
jgi:MerR family transcriptional regulator, copper efflux regulator